MGYTLSAVATYIGSLYTSAVGYVSTSLGVSITTASSIVNAAISTSLSLAATALAKPSLDAQAQKQTIRQSIAPRRRAYGRIGDVGIFKGSWP